MGARKTGFYCILNSWLVIKTAERKLLVDSVAGLATLSILHFHLIDWSIRTKGKHLPQLRTIVEEAVQQMLGSISCDIAC